MFIAGHDRHYKPEDITGIPKQWENFATRIGHILGQVGRVAYGVCSNACGDGDGFQYLTGVGVADLSGLPNDFSGIRLPAQRYVIFTHRGIVSNLRHTIDAIWNQWLPGSGHEAVGSPAFLERYGESFDPQTGTGDIEVWVPIKA
jgi:AraC family transcriptional regulator